MRATAHPTRGSTLRAGLPHWRQGLTTSGVMCSSRAMRYRVVVKATETQAAGSALSGQATSHS